MMLKIEKFSSLADKLMIRNKQNHLCGRTFTRSFLFMMRTGDYRWQIEQYDENWICSVFFFILIFYCHHTNPLWKFMILLTVFLSSCRENERKGMRILKTFQLLGIILLKKKFFLIFSSLIIFFFVFFFYFPFRSDILT